jgi:hypothetical protein
MGTVTELDSEHIVVKTMEGKTSSILLNKDTKYLKGKAAATFEQLRVGDRVVIEAKGKGKKLTATQIKFSSSHEHTGHGEMRHPPAKP